MHRAALNFLGGRIGQAILMRLDGSFYLLLGWSVMAVYDTVLPALPFAALLLLGKVGCCTPAGSPSTSC